MPRTNLVRDWRPGAPLVVVLALAALAFLVMAGLIFVPSRFGVFGG